VRILAKLSPSSGHIYGSPAIHTRIGSPNPIITMSEAELSDQDVVITDDERFSTPSDEKESEEEPPTKRWRASEPPEEIFTEAEQNKEWPFEIIGEDVDHNDNLTCVCYIYSMILLTNTSTRFEVFHYHPKCGLTATQCSFCE